eukprot:CAMPEP_0182436526 /NCGR_PEP_ID=MMETSP1167-20130531/82032_1 /TAXON_ID=2988 /ORGANISM="Mallomonas Sp, Strain CCMP3275" /LENGTH=360 /DNA_ID=CAMNT_0024628791 /DNA_START=68 /DNA_END=1147 /DNA_ORIENTATION=-
MLILIYISLAVSLICLADGVCNEGKEKRSSIVTYFINLERSSKRRASIVKHFTALGMPFERVRAKTPGDFDIPEELSNPVKCIYDSQSTEYTEVGAGLKKKSTGDKRVLITGLCGRPKNKIKELAVTASHLTAIYNAIYSPSSKDKSQYALIVEDDIKIAFDIDLEALVASAPKSFTTLQLFTSNEKSVKMLHEQYLLYKDQKNKGLWVYRNGHGEYYDWWCAGAYIINKSAIKPLLDRILTKLPDGRLAMKIIAAYQHKSSLCVPQSCCHVNNNTLRSNTACVLSPRGFSADHYIYSLGRSYILSVPLITSGSLGNRSTLHQEHVDMHSKAFERMENIIDAMRKGFLLLPSFARQIDSS